MFNLYTGYLLGAAMSQCATDTTKYSIGRLRPHFIDVCQPDWTKVRKQRLLQSISTAYEELEQPFECYMYIFFTFECSENMLKHETSITSKMVLKAFYLKIEL